MPNEPESLNKMDQTYIQTPIGFLEIKGEPEAVFSIRFVDETREASVHASGMVEKAAFQLGEYFEGKRKDFELDLLPYGTPFQRKVWDSLQHIPYGKTISYLDLTKKIGPATAIRAVAAANGKNPIAVVIPCHRVIGRDGSLTGYAGGLHRKRFLLNLEAPVKQTSLF